MCVLKLERTRDTFMEKITTKDPKTQAGYVQALNNFENYCMEKMGKADYVTDLKKYVETDLFEFLQAWINWNNSRAPRTVTNYFSRVKKYLHYRGIKLHPQDIKEELDFKRKMSEELYGLSLDDIQTVLKALRYKHKVQFICQLSALMRIGETVQLRKKHLVTTGLNIIVKIPPNIAKFKKGRTTFFTKEASRLLRPILRELKDDDFVFGTSNNPRFSELNTEQILRRTLKRVGLDMKYESNNRYMINTHSFRAYGITKISRHDPNFAKKLAGQKGYLDEYDRMTDEEKLELYQKLEVDLIIDDSEKQKAKIKELEEEKSENQFIKNEVLRQGRVIENLSKKITKLKIK